MARRKRKIEKLYNRFKFYPLDYFSFYANYPQYKPTSDNYTDSLFSSTTTFIILGFMVSVVLSPLFFVVNYFWGDYFIYIFLIYQLICLVLAQIIDYNLSTKEHKYGKYCKLFDRELDKVQARWIRLMFLVDFLIIIVGIALILFFYKLFHYLLPIIWG